MFTRAPQGLIIVGGGQAAHQAAESLRNNGYVGRIRLFSDEIHLPYQQPPLSKAYLKGQVEAEKLAFRTQAFYEEQEIELHLGEAVVSIDAHDMTVTTAQETYGYDKLILATGSNPRTLAVEGANLKGILTLRTQDDAACLAEAMGKAKKLVIIGAGFIGLEVASTALEQGLQVTVVETASRVMARAVSPEVSDFFASAHKDKGLDLSLGQAFSRFEGQNGKVSAVVLEDGQTRLEADLVLLGIGATPNQDIAAAEGLEVNQGIIVDEHMQTSDRHIYAAGDCTRHPNGFWGGMFRLESVQNAIDQAKIAASHICGGSASYKSVPWFWSEQQGHKLQMVGLPKPDAKRVVQGGTDKNQFTVLHFEKDRLTGVEAVNMPAEQMAAKQLLADPMGVSLAQAQAAGSLKMLLKERRQAAEDAAAMTAAEIAKKVTVKAQEQKTHD